MVDLIKLHDAQLKFWRGDVGKQWAANQAHLDQMLEPMGNALLEAVAPCPGERVLDIGCGCGATSFQAAEWVGDNGWVTGLDLSPDMIDVAKAKVATNGLRNVAFALSDAATRAFEPEWDLVMSRFGVMFFGDPATAFGNLRHALKPTGRLGFVCWRAAADNQWISVPLAAASDIIELPNPPHPNAPGPFALANPDRINTILSGAGFSQIKITAVDRKLSMRFDDDDPCSRAAEFLVEFGPLSHILGKADQASRTRVKQRLPEVLGAFETEGTMTLSGAGWLVSATL